MSQKGFITAKELYAQLFDDQAEEDFSRSEPEEMFEQVSTRTTA